MLCKKCQMLGCFKLHVPTIPLFAQCTECGFNQQVTFEDIPEYGHVYTLEKFIENCKSGGFIDYDGFGNLATKDKMSGLQIKPSSILNDPIYKDKHITSLYTHVVWFNR